VKLKQGEVLIREGEPVHETAPLVYVILDGALGVEVDGSTVGEVGAGAVVGERALLEGGRRSATLTALTPCKILPVPADSVSASGLAELAQAHRRED
jgi:CRP-like cAMP-binding protein